MAIGRDEANLTLERETGKKNMGKAQDILDGIRGINLALLGIGTNTNASGSLSIVTNSTSTSPVSTLTSTLSDSNSSTGLTATAVIEMVFGITLLIFMTYQTMYCRPDRQRPARFKSKKGDSSCTCRFDGDNIAQLLSGLASIAGALALASKRNDADIKTVAFVLIAFSMMISRTVRFFEPARELAAVAPAAPAIAAPFLQEITNISPYTNDQIYALLSRKYSANNPTFHLLKPETPLTLRDRLIQCHKDYDEVSADDRRALIIPINNAGAWSAIIISPGTDLGRDRAIYFNPHGAAAAVPPAIKTPLQNSYPLITNAMLIPNAHDFLAGSPAYEDGPLLVLGLNTLSDATVGLDSLFPPPAPAAPAVVLAPDCTALNAGIANAIGAIANGVRGLRESQIEQYHVMIAPPH